MDLLWPQTRHVCSMWLLICADRLEQSRTIFCIYTRFLWNYIARCTKTRCINGLDSREVTSICKDQLAFIWHFLVDMTLHSKLLTFEQCHNHNKFLKSIRVPLSSDTLHCVISSSSETMHLHGCFCPWTFSLDIGLNILPLYSFMSCLDSLLGYSTGQFQALQLILLVVFGTVD